MKFRALFSAFVLSLALGSCGPSPFQQYQELKNLRVLALIADQPEVAPGSTVTLTPVLSDPFGSGRKLKYSAEACLDLGVAVGASANCEGNPTRTILADPATVTGLTPPEYTQAVTSTFTVTVPVAALIYAGRSESEKHNGVPYLINFRVWADDGSVSVNSFKRVWVSERASKNANPTLTQILVNDLPMVGVPTEKVGLSADFPASSQEGYVDLNSKGETLQKLEKLTVQWFSNYGLLDPTPTDGKEPTSFDPTGRPLDRPLVLVGVLKDDRGGAAVKIRTF